jgi:photosystem II stability/assembly factor-like uncharacterized protein
MKKHLFLLPFLLFITSINAQWSRSNGPYSGHISTIIENSAGLYASGIYSGIYFSPDRGLNWIAVNNGLTNHDVRCMVSNHDTLFAGTSTGIFVSPDNALTWTPSNTGMPASMHITSLSTNNVEVFAGTFQGAFRSANNGANWTRVNYDSTAWIHGITCIGNTLYLSDEFNGLHSSTDNGVTWTPVIIPGDSTTIVSVVSINGGLAVSSNLNTYVSPDGLTWTTVGSGIPCPYGNNLANKGGILIAGGTGLVTSQNSGQSWAADSLNDDVDEILISGNDIIVGTFGGIYISDDNGITWTQINNGLLISEIYSITSKGSSVFASAYGGGIYKSTDNGQTWADAKAGLTTHLTTAIATSGTDLFAGSANYGVFVSNDDGATWMQTATVLPSDYVNDFTFINNEIYAATWTRGIIKSIDGGMTWSVLSGMPQTTVHCIEAIDSVLLAGTEHGIFKSVDHGTSWTYAMSGISDSIGYCLNKLGTSMFLGSRNTVYKTDDYGLNWIDVSFWMTGFFPGVYGLTNDGINIYAQTNNDGIKKSSDNGNNWTSYNTGLLDSNVRSIYATNNRIFAGGQNYGGAVWYQDIVLSNNNYSMELIEKEFKIYPNPFQNNLTITYKLDKRQVVSIEIFNSLGVRVYTLFENEFQNAGSHELIWNAMDAGIYFIKLISEESSMVKKVICQ